MTQPQPTIGTAPLQMLPSEQLFDEIRINVRPRYKTSPYSGNEWRFETRAQFMSGGRVVATISMRSVEEGVRDFSRIYDEAKNFVRSNSVFLESRRKRCQNLGCANEAVVLYRMKKKPCRTCGQSSSNDDFESYRQFCAQHATRGDCSPDDCDDNYERVNVDGPPAEQPAANVVSRSACVAICATESGDFFADLVDASD